MLALGGEAAENGLLVSGPRYRTAASLERLGVGTLRYQGPSLGWFKAVEPEPETEPTGPTSGAYCSFGRAPVPSYMVTHYRCDEYADGAVVDARDGTIVTPAPIGAPRGFDRTTDKNGASA
jgi:hypothetical protein